MHEQNKETLFGMKQLWDGMNILQHEGSQIYGNNIILLSPFEPKQWIADDGVHTNASGYINIQQPFPRYDRYDDANIANINS